MSFNVCVFQNSMLLQIANQRKRGHLVLTSLTRRTEIPIRAIAGARAHTYALVLTWRATYRCLAVIPRVFSGTDTLISLVAPPSIKTFYWAYFWKGKNCYDWYSAFFISWFACLSNGVIITDFSASGLSYIQIIELHLHSQNVWYNIIYLSHTCFPHNPACKYIYCHQHMCRHEDNLLYIYLEDSCIIKMHFQMNAKQKKKCLYNNFS